MRIVYNLCIRRNEAKEVSGVCWYCANPLMAAPEKSAFSLLNFMKLNRISNDLLLVLQHVK